MIESLPVPPPAGYVELSKKILLNLYEATGIPKGTYKKPSKDSTAKELWATARMRRRPEDD